MTMMTVVTTTMTMPISMTNKMKMSRRRTSFLLSLALLLIRPLPSLSNRGPNLMAVRTRDHVVIATERSSRSRTGAFIHPLDEDGYDDCDDDNNNDDNLNDACYYDVREMERRATDFDTSATWGGCVFLASSCIVGVTLEDEATWAIIKEFSIERVRDEQWDARRDKLDPEEVADIVQKYSDQVGASGIVCGWGKSKPTIGGARVITMCEDSYGINEATTMGPLLLSLPGAAEVERIALGSSAQIALAALDTSFSANTNEVNHGTLEGGFNALAAAVKAVEKRKGRADWAWWCVGSEGCRRIKATRAQDGKFEMARGKFHTARSSSNRSPHSDADFHRNVNLE